MLLLPEISEILKVDLSATTFSQKIDFAFTIPASFSPEPVLSMLRWIRLNFELVRKLSLHVYSESNFIIREV